jgi:murein DD-endopeptidase MepM/ murein hydrolase activator NlpD
MQLNTKRVGTTFSVVFQSSPPLLLVFFILIILLLSPTNVQLASAQAGWRTYSQLGGQISVEYPPNYEAFPWKPYKQILASVSFMDPQSSIHQEHPDALEVTRFSKSVNETLDGWLEQVSSDQRFGSSTDPRLLFFEPQQIRALKTDRTILSFWHRVEGEPVFVVLIQRPTEVIAIALITSNLAEASLLFRSFVAGLKIESKSISGIRLEDLNTINKPVFSSGSNSPQAPGIAGYYLPWQNGVTRTVTQGWGPDPGGDSHNTQPNYYAYDIDFGEGIEVWASAPGTVSFSRGDVDPNTCGGSAYANTTNYVTINHDDGRATTYLHLKSTVKTSGTVSQGEHLGYSGKTGWTGCGPHLHFQRQNQGVWFTNSVDVYFIEYPGQTFNQGSQLRSQNSRGGGGCNPNSDQVALFEHPNYGGSCKVFGKSDYPNPGSMGFPNDAASSIKVGGNVKAVLCKDDNLNGGCEEFTGDDSDLNGNSIGDNQVSSMKVQDRGGGGCSPNSEQVALFEHPNYQGTCKVFGKADYPNPGSMGFPNDSASSIKVGGNAKAVLCRDDNYGGGCEDFNGDDSDLNGNSIGDNQVSSLKVQGRGGGDGDGIEICDGTNYGSPCTTLTAGKIGNLNDIGWYDRIESLRFKGSYAGNYHVVLSTETGHGGTPGHFERDEANIPDPWRNRTRSIEIYFIDRNQPPSRPTLSSPDDWYESTDGNAPNLCWNASSDPEGNYPVQYFAEVFDSAVNANTGWTTSTCWRPAALDNQHFTFKWRVRARDNKNKESDWSDTRQFSIRNVPRVPDLRPYAPAGFPAPGVPSSIQGTHATNTLYAGARTFVDWHFSNTGSGTAPGGFHVDVYLNNERIVHYPQPDFGAGQDGGFDDWAILVAQPGTHTLKIITDPENVVQESDETNNIWEQQFTWQTISGWKGEYFNNPSLDGNPWLTRDDSNINFTWLSDPPDPSLPSDNFSVRWSRSVTLDAAPYRFTVLHDDGARLIIDGNRVLDNWCNPCYAQDTVNVNLNSGNHTIVLEMYDGGGWASVNLSWEKLAQPDLVVESISANPPNPLVGQNIDFTVRIKNQGSAAAVLQTIPGLAPSRQNAPHAPNAKIFVDLYIDHEPTGCDDYDSVAYWELNMLGPGQVQELHFTHPGFDAGGTHTLYAFVDSECSIQESVENNNLKGPQNLSIQVPTQTPTRTNTPTKTFTPVTATVTPTWTNTPKAPTATPTVPVIVLKKPKLKVPANGARITTKKVKMDWEDVHNATSYQIQVRDGGKAGAKVVDATMPKSKRVFKKIVKGHTYVWRVRACAPPICGKWSGWRGYQVQ